MNDHDRKKFKISIKGQLEDLAMESSKPSSGGKKETNLAKLYQ